MSDNDLLTMEQAAELLGITRRALAFHAKAGRVGFQPGGAGKGWIFTRQDVERFDREYERKPGRPSNATKGKKTA